MDWPAVRKRLLHGGQKLRPWEVSRLTEPEVLHCLDEDLETRRPPRGGEDLGAWGVIEYARRWRQQTAAERLAKAREG